MRSNLTFRDGVGWISSHQCGGQGGGGTQSIAAFGVPCSSDPVDMLTVVGSVSPIINHF